jgi:hypothetical protein
MASIDSQKDNVALEAMNSLAKVFQVVDETRIAPVLINVCHRIRPGTLLPLEPNYSSSCSSILRLLLFL